MKIIFYDTKSAELNYFKQSLPSNFEAFFEPQRLTSLEKINENYKTAEGLSVFVSSVLDSDVLAKFSNLKFIFLRSAGFSNVDLEYCKNHNIYVFNVPEYGTTTVAEFVFGLILSISKNITYAFKQMRQGEINQSDLVGVELENKTLGIIGTGLIGRKTAQIAKGFNLNVIAYDINKTEGYNYVELDELFEKSDFISINCPLNEKTRGLINKSSFEKMKNSAFLINTARGEIVKSEDLYYALIEKKIKGAALDVIECEEYLCELYENCTKNEYLKDICLKKYLFIERLSKLPNVIITPHIAYNTKEANNRIIETTLQNIKTSLGEINSGTKNLVLI